MHLRRSLLLLLLGAVPLTAAELVALPPPVVLSAPGHTLIVDQETGGFAYYQKCEQFPEWPEGDSGVTIGVGYDLSTVSRPNILEDWKAVPQPNLDRLAATQPFHGTAARQKARDLRDILIAWHLAIDVFDRVDVPRFYQLTRRAFPGFDDLRPNAQAALVSLVFNRGAAMQGAARREMRTIRDDVPRQDYAGMARALRAMVWVWRGSAIEDDMTRRRNAEADLVLTP